MLAFDHLSDMWGLPRVIRHQFEYPVDGGRIDLLLVHVDDTATIVEVKAGRSAREVVAGIGQLFYYGSLLPECPFGFRPVIAVRRLLCSMLYPESALPVMDACNAAGVRYGHLPPYGTLKALTDKYREAA